MRIFACCTIVMILLACSDNQKVPSGVIPKAKMEKVLWDMVQADKFVEAYVGPKKDSLLDKKKETFLYYQKVFQLHGISHEEFLKSYDFYLGRPDILKVMFDSISAQAERSRGQLYKEKFNREQQQRTKDSVLRSRNDSILRSKKDSMIRNRRDSLLKKR